jgi:predicted transcriptional regulator
MSTLRSRVQVLLTDEQHEALLALARARGQSISVLLREAIVERLLKDAAREAKVRACEEIAAMDLPTGQWPDMEAEIIRARTP